MVLHILSVLLYIYMASDKLTTVLITKSSKTDKKYQAQINNKTIHFGTKGYEDYTTHHDIERKIDI